MFVRYLVDLRSVGSPDRLGVFQAIRGLRDLGALSAAELSRADAAMQWLADHLPSPPGRVWSRRRRPVSWFRPAAHAHQARARDVAALLASKGVSVAAVITSDPGRVVYADRFQVLAVPPPGEAV